jgi:hypothetical protein
LIKASCRQRPSPQLMRRPFAKARRRLRPLQRRRLRPRRGIVRREAGTFPSKNPLPGRRVYAWEWQKVILGPRLVDELHGQYRCCAEENKRTGIDDRIQQHSLCEDHREMPFSPSTRERDPSLLLLPKAVKNPPITEGREHEQRCESVSTAKSKARSFALPLRNATSTVELSAKSTKPF